MRIVTSSKEDLQSCITRNWSYFSAEGAGSIYSRSGNTLHTIAGKLVRKQACPALSAQLSQPDNFHKSFSMTQWFVVTGPGRLFLPFFLAAEPAAAPGQQTYLYPYMSSS
jgi:hypothetical protein